MNIRKYKKVVIICAAVAACIGIVMGLSRHIYSPFDYSITCRKVSDVAEYEKGTVILNDYDLGIMFLNENGQLASYLSDNDILGTDVVRYTAVEGYKDNVWIHECVSQNDSFFITEERVVRYSHDGKRLETVFTLKHDVSNPEDCFEETGIVGMVVDENAGDLCILGEDDILKILEFDIYESSDGKELYSLDTAALGISDPLITAKYFRDADIIAAADILGKIYKITPSGNVAECVGRSESLKDIFDFELLDDGSIVPVYELGVDGLNIPFSFGLIFKNILFYLFIIYLSVLIIAWCISTISNLIKNNRLDIIKQIFFVTLAVIIAAVLVIFYSHALTEQSLENDKTTCAAVAAMIRDEIKEPTVSLLKSYDDDNIDEELFREIGDYLNNKIYISQLNGESLDIILVKNTDDGYVSINGGYNSVQFGTATGMDKYALEILNEDSDVSVSATDSVWGTYMVANAHIRQNESDADAIGAIVVYEDLESFYLERRRSNILLFIGLFTAGIGGIFILFEAKAWLASFGKYRRARRSKVKYPEFYLQRPMLFISMSATAMDLSLCVLIGKDMLLSAGYEADAFMLSLPESLGTLGMFIGIALYGLLCRRCSPRKLSVAFFGIGALAYAGMFIGVRSNNFPLFLMMELVSTLGVVAGESYIVQLALLAPNEDESVGAAKNHTMVKISSGALAGLAAGYIAQSFGNEWLYFSAGILAIIEIVFLSVLLKGAHSQIDAPSDKPDQNKGFSLILSSELISLAMFVIVPANLAGVYKSFLFPLLADAHGIEKAIISSSSAIANVICFGIMESMSKKIKNYSYKSVSIVSSIALAISYAIFIFTDSIAWVFIMLIVTKVISSVESICWKTLCPNIAKSSGIPAKKADTLARLADSAASTAKSPIAGAFLTVSQNALCLFLAAYGTASGVLYSLFGKKSGSKEE